MYLSNFFFYQMLSCLASKYFTTSTKACQIKKPPDNSGLFFDRGELSFNSRYED